MPGIATLFQTLDLTIAKLDAEGLSQFSGVMRNNPYAYLGAIGASIGDFLPSDASQDSQPESTYASVWRTIFRYLGGDLGILATLRGINEVLDQLEPVAKSEDLDALKGLADGGITDKIEALAQNFEDLVTDLQDKAPEIGRAIAKDLRPKVATASKTDPVPSPEKWTARDVLHWKRSGRFVRNLLDKAQTTNDDRLRAYAYGYLVSYATKVCGSPFVNSSVGGPFRTQWWRQRLVRNYVDAWVHGYYTNQPGRPTFTNDVPSPAYADWPQLCGANLHKRLNLGPSDPIAPGALLDLVKTRKPFPSALPADFAQRWFEALQATYGSAVPPNVTAGALNDAYLTTWLLLWVQTSGIFGCRLPPPTKPPDDCGTNESTLDPFQEKPGGGVNLPPSTKIDPDTDETKKICGIIWAILGAVAFVAGAAAQGATALGFGIDAATHSVSVDWKKIRCMIYWYRMYMYNGLNGLQKFLALTGFGYPDTKDFTDDPLVLKLRGLTGPTLGTGLTLVRSKVPEYFPSKPWITVDPTDSETQINIKLTTRFEKAPDASDPGFEAPNAVAYLAGAYPSFFIDDDVANPMGGDVKTGGGFPFRSAGIIGAALLPMSFGNAVANAVDLFKHMDAAFPDWNLDGDRGLAWVTWQFKGGKYDPDAVQVEAES